MTSAGAATAAGWRAAARNEDIPPGRAHEGILAFRGAKGDERTLEVGYAPAEGPPRSLTCRLPPG